MKFRSKMTRGRSKRLFSKTASRTHYRNTMDVNPMVMRGGTRL